MKGETTNNMNEQLQQIAALAAKLCDKLNAAIEAVDAGELIADRAALRNITGALKDLRDLFEEQAPKEADAPALQVTFAGDADTMSV